MKRMPGALFLAFVTVSLVMASRTSQACVFGDNNYCVSCPDGSVTKVNNCPGGDVGMVIVGTQNQNCSVNYFDGRSCIPHGPRPGFSATLQGQEDIQSIPTNIRSPKPRVGISMMQDRVILDMSLQDFQKVQLDLGKIEQ